MPDQDPPAEVPSQESTISAPALPPPFKPRVIVYAQTHHLPDGTPVSLLPLVAEETGITHVIIAAVHLNDNQKLTLNDDPADAPRLSQLWDEVTVLQESGVPVLAMLGGAAKGSYDKLGGSDVDFELDYAPLHAFLRSHALSGIDLDVEEPTPLSTMLRLIRRLRADFGPSFLITLAPVLPALVPQGPHLSGFSYFELDALLGREISWYNAQLYCGWGDARSPAHYEAALARGSWDSTRVVLGVVTCPDNGAGYVPVAQLEGTVRQLRRRCGRWDEARAEVGEGFGGVMGWEYFNAVGREGRRGVPRGWVAAVAGMMRDEPSGLGAAGQRVPGERGMADTTAVIGEAPHAFPAASVEALKGLGFAHQQVIAALNMTGGNVEYAAGVLFEQ